MRKVDNGEKKEKKEKNGVFSGHYVIASSLPPERLHPNDDHWNAARSCQKKKKGKKREENTDENSGHYVIASSRPPKRRPLEGRTLAPIFFF